MGRALFSKNLGHHFVYQVSLRKHLHVGFSNVINTSSKIKYYTFDRTISQKGQFSHSFQNTVCMIC